MALEMNLSVPEHMLNSQMRKSLSKIPLQAMTSEQEDEARLQILDTIFDPDGSHLNQGISAEHYHLPILFLQNNASQSELVLEAWIRSALFHSYNLVLISQVPLSAKTQQLLKETPQAREHLAIRAYATAESQCLQAAIPQFIPTQEPHLYLCQNQVDQHLKHAMQAGFLAISTVQQALIQDHHDGFILEANSARALAQGLLEILENAEYDWTYLQDCVFNAQNKLNASSSG